MINYSNNIAKQDTNEYKLCLTMMLTNINNDNLDNIIHAP